MTMQATAGAQVDVGRILSGAADVLRSSSVPLLILAAPFVILPQLLAGLLPPDAAVISNLASLPGLVFQGGGTLIAYRALTGGPPLSFGEAAGAGARRFGSLFLGGLLSGFAYLSFLALLVPGFYVAGGMLAWPAVMMVENARASDALGRSWSLSTGARWRLAAAFAVLAAIFVVFIVAIFGVALLSERTAYLINNFLITPLFVLVLNTASIAVSTSAYVELKRMREGGVSSELAQIFD